MICANEINKILLLIVLIFMGYAKYLAYIISKFLYKF